MRTLRLLALGGALVVALLGHTAAGQAQSADACSQPRAAGDEASPNVSITDANVQSALVLQKNNAENLVLQVKATYKPDMPEYKKAQALYNDALSKFNAYTSLLLLNYRVGNKVDFSEVAKQASDAASRFAACVSSFKVQTRSIAAIIGLLPDLIKIGDMLWTRFEKTQSDRRKALAEGLSKLVTWQPWAQVGGTP